MGTNTEHVNMSTSRDYIRHPSGIPIKVVPQSNPKQMNLQLNNVSVGGLCFDTPDYLSIGGVVKVTINSVKPVFKVKGIVQWCDPKPKDAEGGSTGYTVGIEFVSPNDAFRVRMVEQVCHIEQYKKEIKESEGRRLTSQKAAIEWIAKHGAEFPNPEKDAPTIPNKAS